MIGMSKNVCVNVELNFRGVSGSTLKLIALAAMLIDHIAATVLYGYIVSMPGTGELVFERAETLINMYYILRIIGRVSFPIYIFLLIEGLEHTKNQCKYVFRMFIFAIISEIPFDLAFNLNSLEICNGRIIEFDNQNVFFTLFIGLIVIICIREADSLKCDDLIKRLLAVAAVVAGTFLAWLFSTDYSCFGVLAIVAMYLFREKTVIAVLAMTTMLMFIDRIQIVCLLSYIPLSLYNGKRGWSLKWLFYIFYPAHLLVLWGVCLAIGIK